MQKRGDGGFVDIEMQKKSGAVEAWLLVVGSRPYQI
jgi:hypothetical protein